MTTNVAMGLGAAVLCGFASLSFWWSKRKVFSIVLAGLGVLDLVTAILRFAEVIP